ncbi:MAG: M1 family metallopeptidase [Saprospiraceae bacterium]|nr:M1 family metallopeptidase [Saprospiraceae bacterium]
MSTKLKLYPYLLFILLGWMNPLSAQKISVDTTLVCPYLSPNIQGAYIDWGAGKRNKNSNCRSDSFDIIHYNLELRITNLRSKYIEGICELSFKAKLPMLKQIRLDLKQLKVDSVILANQQLAFNQEKKKDYFDINFPQDLDSSQVYKLRIHYQGVPKQGAWNGFYFSRDLAYNMGSSFDANPHNFGRAWYPCFDNFKERASYTFQVTSKAPLRAYCNGELTDEAVANGLVTRTWELEQPIPTYLSNIVIGEFVELNWWIHGQKDSIPVQIACLAEDTSKIINYFQHLDEAIATFEHWFGPYAWNKVGYTVVNGVNGAMEHATNITFSDRLLSSALFAEEFMAHELGHSWFGNQITCETSEDMWINEGFATYCEQLFWEKVYGEAYFKDQVQINRSWVLPHFHDTDYFSPPLAGAPHRYTYDARHIYRKGAMIAHNMRTYLGDSLFKQTMHGIFEAHKYQSINSERFCQAIETHSGRSFRYFFDDWVYKGGFPHLEIDSMQVNAKNGFYNIDFLIEQKLIGREKYYQNLPSSITFYDKHWNKYRIRVESSNQYTNIQAKLSFYPICTILNEDQILNDATLSYQRVYKGEETVKKKPSLFLKNLKVVVPEQDSALIRINYHIASPDTSQTEQFICSTQRFWSVEGIFTATTSINFQLELNEYIDFDLDGIPKTKLVLLYRPSDVVEWAEYTDYKVVNSLINPIAGYVQVNQAKKGDYCFGLKRQEK